MLLDAMETDARLRETFFSRLGMLFHAGAGMSQPVWDRITRIAAEMVPGGVPLCTGFGSTETGRSALPWHKREKTAGNLDVPLPGVTFKLVPQGDKREGRVKGPPVTPGYWRNPELTRAAFDKGEVTDKGSVNRRAVLRHRADLVEALWSDDPRVIPLGHPA